MSTESDRELIHAAALALERATGFLRFSVMGMDGLWRTDGASLEILAIHASQPGTGQCRRFIREMQQRFESVSVWEIWNDNLRAALIRYGFKPASLKRDGEKLVGLRWLRSQPQR